MRRDGADVHSDVHISIAQAVFGGTVKAPSVYDDVELKVSSSHCVTCWSFKSATSSLTFNYKQTALHHGISCLDSGRDFLSHAHALGREGHQTTTHVRTRRSLREHQDRRSKVRIYRNLPSKRPPVKARTSRAQMLPVLASTGGACSGKYGNIGISPLKCKVT